MKQTTKRTVIACVVVLVGIPAILYAVSPTVRGELQSASSCYTLAKSGFRPLAEDRAECQRADAAAGVAQELAAVSGHPYVLGHRASSVQFT